MRPNYFIFMGYLKTGGSEGVQVNHPNPLLHSPLKLAGEGLTAYTSFCVFQTADPCRFHRSVLIWVHTLSNIRADVTAVDVA